MERLELHDNLRQPIDAQHRHPAHVDGMIARALRLRGIGQQVIIFLHHPRGIGQQPPPHLGQADLPGGADKQLAPQLFFQGNNAFGNGGLRNIQLVGGRCKVPAAADRDEKGHLLQSHRAFSFNRNGQK